MHHETATHGPGEWRHGWPMVAAGVIGMTLMGFHSGTLGTMMKPLSIAYGWSRSEISAGLTICTVLMLFVTPVVALIIPRYGVIKVVIVGSVLYSLGLVSLGFCTPSIWTWYFGWTVLGIGVSGISALTWTTVITHAFERHRGFALSVALSGTGIAAFATPLVTAYSFQVFGLRMPFFILGGVACFVVLPTLYALMRLRPAFSARNMIVAAKPDAAEVTGRQVREVLRDPAMWQLVLISLLLSAAVGLLYAHLQPMMRDAGASATEAAAYFTLTGPALICGRLATGMLLDRLPTRLISAAMFLLPGLTCVLLLNYDGSTFWGLAICVTYGLGFGAESDVLSYVTSRYFGTGHYALVYSIVYGVFSIGCGVAAVLGGATYDHFGSYAVALYALIGCIALAIAMIFVMRPAGAKDNPVLDGTVAVADL